MKCRLSPEEQRRRNIIKGTFDSGQNSTYIRIDKKEKFYIITFRNKDGYFAASDLDILKVSIRCELKDVHLIEGRMEIKLYCRDMEVEKNE